MVMHRRREREEAFKLLFEAQFLNITAEELLKSYYDRAGKVKGNTYIDDIVSGALSMQDKIGSVLEMYAVNWKKERLSKVVYAILSLAVYELYCRPDVPSSVSANEAVELAKIYEGEDASSFINGILGSFIREEESSFGKEEGI